RGRRLPGDRLTPRMEDYTGKYKGEQVEVALFGGEYQEGVLTAYCYVEDIAHLELNGHILIPLQNIASLHCSSRCDAPKDDWPPRASCRSPWRRSSTRASNGSRSWRGSRNRGCTCSTMRTRARSRPAVARAALPSPSHAGCWPCSPRRSSKACSPTSWRRSTT